MFIDFICEKKTDNGYHVRLYSTNNGFVVYAFSPTNKLLSKTAAGTNEKIAMSIFDVVMDLYKE